MVEANMMKHLAKPETEYVVQTASGESMKFRIIHWSPTKVFQRISLVGKYFYVPISMISGYKPEDPAFADAIPAALLQLFNTMEENDLIGFMAIMLDDVYYNNQPVVATFDTLFLGKNEVVLQLIGKVLEVNYAPFFQDRFHTPPELSSTSSKPRSASLNPSIEKAIKAAHNSSSLNWVDMIYLKVVKGTSETRYSLDQYDVGYLLHLYEGLLLEEYIQGLYKKDQYMKYEEAEKNKKNKIPMMGG